MEDLIQIVTAAAREGSGDLVWLSWDGKNQSGFRCKPVHASTCVAVTSRAARALGEALRTGEMGQQHHWDVMLVRYLQKMGDRFPASYVYPCIGHYQEHVSGSSDRMGWRDSQWAKAWVQEGTRAADTEGGKHRWLAGFRTKGIAWMRQVKLPLLDEDLRWFTRSSAPDGWQEERLQLIALENEERKGRGKGPRWPMLIQPVFDVSAVEMDDNPPPTTKRSQRAQRAAVRDYAFRLFVNEGSQRREAWQT